MGLFDRDYDRDYGYRGSTAGYRRGYDRGERGWWDRTTDRGQDAFSSGDYDRQYGRGYDRGTGYYRGTTGYYGGTSSGYGGTTGYYGGATGYDQAIRGYGRDYKSREQTDFGDPFGDRQSRTPIRMVREREEGGGWFGWGQSDYDQEYRYDQGYRGGEAGYGRYRTGVGYDPYASGRYNRSAQQTGRRYDAFRNYDRGWF